MLPTLQTSTFPGLIVPSVFYLTFYVTNFLSTLAGARIKANSLLNVLKSQV